MSPGDASMLRVKENTFFDAVVRARSDLKKRYGEKTPAKMARELADSLIAQVMPLLLSPYARESREYLLVGYERWKAARAQAETTGWLSEEQAKGYWINLAAGAKEVDKVLDRVDPIEVAWQKVKKVANAWASLQVPDFNKPDNWLFSALKWIGIGALGAVGALLVHKVVTRGSGKE